MQGGPGCLNNPDRLSRRNGDERRKHRLSRFQGCNASSGSKDGCRRRYWDAKPYLSPRSVVVRPDRMACARCLAPWKANRQCAADSAEVPSTGPQGSSYS